VQPDRIAVAGTLVQVIDVLRDDGEHTAMARREFSQRAVPRIRLRRAHAVAAFGIPVPHPPRVGEKTLFAGELRGVEAAPQAGAAAGPPRGGALPLGDQRRRY
jgi:hypothetical protein